MEYRNENLKKESIGKLISVIIPVYNSENYIREAMDSIINQSYANWEIIVVDDGSEDNSVKIVEEYCEKEKRIRILTTKRKGAGLARNEGMKEASGEYIVFLDADDYIPNRDILKKYIEITASIHADIVVSNYARLWDSKVLPSKTTLSFSSSSPLSHTFQFQGFFSVGTLSYVWGKLYRKSFLEENGILFEDFSYSEDKLFNIQCYVCDAKYVFLQDIGYVYRKNTASISWKYRSDSYENWIEIAKEIQNWIVLKKKDLTMYQDLVHNTIVFAAFFDGKMEYTYQKNTIRAIRRVLKKYSQDPFAEECFVALSKKKTGKECCDLWDIAIKGFAICMRLHFYFILSAGIQFLIDHKIDEKLSDTGLREQR